MGDLRKAGEGFQPSSWANQTPHLSYQMISHDHLSTQFHLLTIYTPLLHVASLKHIWENIENA